MPARRLVNDVTDWRSRDPGQGPANVPHCLTDSYRTEPSRSGRGRRPSPSRPDVGGGRLRGADRRTMREADMIIFCLSGMAAALCGGPTATCCSEDRCRAALAGPPAARPVCLPVCDRPWAPRSGGGRPGEASAGRLLEGAVTGRGRVDPLRASGRDTEVGLDHGDRRGALVAGDVHVPQARIEEARSRAWWRTCGGHGWLTAVRSIALSALAGCSG